MTQIVWDYLVANDDPVTRREFIAEVVWQLHDEFHFWVQRMVSIQKGSKEYKLARYWVEVDGPRPGEKIENFIRRRYHLKYFRILLRRLFTINEYDSR